MEESHQNPEPELPVATLQLPVYRHVKLEDTNMYKSKTFEEESSSIAFWYASIALEYSFKASKAAPLRV